MADQTINVKLLLDDSRVKGSLQDLKRYAIELQGSLGSAILNDKDKQAILVRLADVKGKMQDLKASVTAFDPGDTFGNFATMLGIANTALVGVSASLKVFGADEKQIKDIQDKLNAAIQVGVVLQQLADTSRLKGMFLYYANKLKELVVVGLGIVATKAQAAANELEEKTTLRAAIAKKVAAAAQWLWNAAMAANPIGLVVAAVAALAAGIYFLVKAMSAEKEESKELQEIRAKHIKTMDDLAEKYADANDARKVAKGEMLSEEAALNKIERAHIKLTERLNFEEVLLKKLKDAGYENTEEYKKRKLAVDELRVAYTLSAVELAAATEAETTAKKKKEEEDKKEAARLAEYNSAINVRKRKVEDLIKLEQQQINTGDKRVQQTALRIRQLQDQIKWEEELAKILNSAPTEIKPLKVDKTSVGKDLDKIVSDNTLKAVNVGMQLRTALSEGFKTIPEGDKPTTADLIGISEDDYTAMINNLKEIGIEGIGQLLSQSLAMNTKTEIDNMNAAIQEGYDKESQALEDSRKRNLITEEEYNKQKEKLDSKQAKLVKAAKEKEWKLNQKAALIQVAIDTAVGIAKTLATLGMPLAIPGMIVAAAAGVAQAAIIASQKMPQFAKGGVLQGPSHANGGILTNFGTVEGGEFITNKLATQQNLPTLQAINGNNDMITQLIQEVRVLQDINMRPTRAVVLESDITNTQNKIRKIEASASL